MIASPPLDRCLVCGLDESVPAAGGLVRRCVGCSFGWTAEALAPSEELYGAEYHDGDGYDDYYQPAARRAESRKRLRWVLDTGPVGSLFEAGAAGGYFVEQARLAGIDASGVELSPQAASHARDVVGVPVTSGFFEEVEVDEPVDVVCAFHVLEHVEDPRSFLATAHRLLVPGGRLTVEVPNLASAAARRLGPQWPHIQPRFHWWHFTAESLTRLLAANGFTATRVDTIFSRFYWPPAARLRHTRELWVADVVASRSPRVTHPSLGDFVRIVAVREAA